MSTNSPSNFICTTLSLGSDAWRYAPRTSKVCTNLPLWALIDNDANSDYNVMVGDVASYRVIWVRWRLLSAHFLSLVLPHRFSLIRLTDLSALYFSWREMIVASWGPKISRLYNFLCSFNIATTDHFPYLLIPFFHLSETSVDRCLVVLVSPSLSFRFLGLEKLRASLGLM